MKAVRRVLAAPWAWLMLWGLHLLFAWLFSASVYAGVQAVMEGRAWLDDGHRLFALGELIGDHPSIGAAAATAVMGSAVIGFALWVVASGGIITRLAGVARGRQALSNTGRFLPEILVQSVWALLARIVLVGLALLPMRSAPLLSIVLLAAVIPLTAFAADAARVLAVFKPDSPYHPRLYWRALTTTVRRPMAWLLAVVFTALQLGGVLMILYLGLADRLGPNTLPGLRVLALVPLFFALCRVGLAIETFVPPVAPDSDPRI